MDEDGKRVTRERNKELRILREIDVAEGAVADRSAELQMKTNTTYTLLKPNNAQPLRHFLSGQLSIIFTLTSIIRRASRADCRYPSFEIQYQLISLRLFCYCYKVMLPNVAVCSDFSALGHRRTMALCFCC